MLLLRKDDGQETCQFNILLKYRIDIKGSELQKYMLPPNFARRVCYLENGLQLFIARKVHEFHQSMNSSLTDLEMDGRRVDLDEGRDEDFGKAINTLGMCGQKFLTFLWSL